LTASRERHANGLGWNRALSLLWHHGTVKKTGAVSTEHNATKTTTVQPILSMADQELPFDRYWSKN